MGCYKFHGRSCVYFQGRTREKKVSSGVRSSAARVKIHQKKRIVRTMESLLVVFFMYFYVYIYTHMGIEYVYAQVTNKIAKNGR